MLAAGRPANHLKDPPDAGEIALLTKMYLDTWRRLGWIVTDDAEAEAHAHIRDEEEGSDDTADHYEPTYWPLKTSPRGRFRADRRSCTLMLALKE